MIDEIKQSLAAATPGPWEFKTNRHPEFNGNEWGWIDSKGGQIAVWSESRNANYLNDNRLIVNAPEWLAWQNAEIERYREALGRIAMQSSCDGAGKTLGLINEIAHETLDKGKGESHERSDQ